ncbi:hypothetical protein quinque_014831 [Culex quinquefasciatus]
MNNHPKATKQLAASEFPLFQMLMSIPVHTLDQIEKQQQATTPLKDSAIVTGKLTTELSVLEKTFKLMDTPISSGPALAQELPRRQRFSVPPMWPRFGTTIS